jgi:hypothetical protein
MSEVTRDSLEPQRSQNLLILFNTAEPLKHLTKPPPRQLACAHLNFAYSALASFRIDVGVAAERLYESRELQIKGVNFLRAHVAQHKRGIIRG